MRAWPGIARRQEETVTKKKIETKNETKKPPRGTSAGRVARDWQPLFHRLQDAIEWALDIAAHLAREIDEDVEAVERTRGYVRAWIGGHEVDVDMTDVLTTLAVLFAAIELDLGIDSSPILDGLTLGAQMFHLPGARTERPTVVIRSPIVRRRNGADTFTHLAA
jgi:hypothetical protein